MPLAQVLPPSARPFPVAVLSMMAADDADFPSAGGSPPGKRQKTSPDKGVAREYLKVWETAPAQLLNAYGVAKFVEMPDVEVWKHQ